MHGEGIVLIYNGSNSITTGDPYLANGTYAAGQALMDPQDPSHLLDRTKTYFINPDKSYELAGQVNNVCFIEGLAYYNNNFYLYYGTADSKLAVAIWNNVTLPPGLGTNLALNKPVTVSSIESGSVPGNYAVDGSFSTRWSSLASDPQWINVDLGSVQNINRVRLFWESAYGKSYKIQVSNDATNWTDVFSTTTGLGGADEIPFPTTGARYVRMYGTQRGTGYGYSLYEFEVYGTTAIPSPSSIATPTPTATATPSPTVTPTPTPTHTSGSNIQVNLSSYFNMDGFSYDSNRNDGNYGGVSGAHTNYSADLVNTNPTYDSTGYNLGPIVAGSTNAVKGTGQTITVPQGKYSSFRFLGSTTNGNQTGAFQIKYSDGTSSSTNVTEKDWCTSNTSGQKIVQTMGHRHDNGIDQTINTYVFAYYLTPTAGKTVTGLVLPNNANVHVLAITLVP